MNAFVVITVGLWSGFFNEEKGILRAEADFKLCLF